MRPDFGCGIHDLVFEPNTAALRGLVQATVRDGPDPLGAAHRRARRAGEHRRRANATTCSSRIDYRVRSNNAFFNLVYPFFLDEGVGLEATEAPEVDMTLPAPISTSRTRSCCGAHGASRYTPEFARGLDRLQRERPRHRPCSSCSPGSPRAVLDASTASPTAATSSSSSSLGLELRPARPAPADLTFTPRPGRHPRPPRLPVPAPRSPANPPTAATC